MSDYIDRQDAIDAHCELCGDRGKCSDICPDVEVFKLLPSVQPEREQGKWIPQGWNGTYCKCSCCDAVYVTAEIPYNFCPNCGADMRETE